jgi:hypothetical protein
MATRVKLSLAYGEDRKHSARTRQAMRGPQCNQSDLRRTVQTNGHLDRPNSGIRVQGERTNLPQSPGIFPSQPGQLRRPDERKPYLASVGVSRELEIDGMVGHVIGPVRLMS